uniref:Putative conserved plasma membrane protein n=1 Tax=Amblyomma sculptum TaxID=1581419 RepID=A0A1E1XKW6_AMBSC
MASREKAKGQHAPKSGRLPRRWVACFVLAILQTIIGLGLLAVGAADVVFTLDHNCKDRTGASFLQGVVCVVSGAFALAAYSPRRVRAQGHPNRVLVAVHVLLSFLVAVVSFNVVTCLASYTGDRTAALFAVILSKVVLTYTCHVLGGVCAGVAVPDLCRNGAGLVTFDAFQRDVTAKQAPQNQSSAPTAAAPSSVAGPVQLPEARSHVQEAPGTGEKLTVVTLPEADVIYAVPENSYVVRRSEGSYVAPPGNSRLAPFFPTYTRVAIE